MTPESTPRTLTLRWTTPIFRHELTVAPEQVTTTTSGGLGALVIRAVCHLLIDQLPVRAYGELVPTLVDMRDFYSGTEREAHPQLRAARPLKVLARTTRPEVEFGED